MKTSMLCALALTLTTACLPTLNPQTEPDASTDASTDADVTADGGDGGDGGDAAPDTSADRFGFASGEELLRIGSIGDQNTSISFMNTSECEGSPALVSEDVDVFSASRVGEQVTIQAKMAGAGTLQATCGAQAATLEIIVMPVSKDHLDDVVLWSRGDHGVDVEEDDNGTLFVTKWRNLAQQSPTFVKDPNLNPPRYDTNRGAGRLSFGIERDPASGLSLVDEDGGAAPIMFQDGLTALFVTRTSGDRKHTLTDSNDGGDYSIYMTTDSPPTQTLGVLAKPEGAEVSGKWEEPNISQPNDIDGKASGVVLDRMKDATLVLAYPSPAGASTTYRIDSPEDDDPTFVINTLGANLDATPMMNTGFKGHVYEVLLIDGALSPNEVEEIINEMTPAPD